MRISFITFLFLTNSILASLFAQQITVTSPNGGESWQYNTSENILWSDNISENVKIDLYKAGNLYSTIVSSTPSDGFFTWNISDSVQSGSDYQVKITSVADSNINDLSDANFTLVGKQITVTSPNGGENWQAGTSHGITWTDNILDNVKIELYKGGSLYYIIVNSTASNGYYLWNIPDTAQSGSDFRVKISSVSDINVSDISVGNFTIIGNQITVTSPNGGEIWDSGTGYGITWTDNISDNVKIDLIKGGSLYYTIAASIPSNGYYAWTLPDTLQGGSNYRVKITSVNNSSINDVSDGDFTVVGKVITVTSPNGGENWQTGSSQAVTWTDNVVENVKIDLYKGGSFYYTINSSTESDGYYLWTLPDTTQAGSDYKIKVTSILYGSITDQSNGNFTLFSQQIAVTSPNGGEMWDAGTGYGIEWTDNISENVKIDLYKGGSLYYTIAASAPSNGYYAWAVPDTLQGGSNYRVRITSVTNSNVNDISDGDFTVVGKVITVTSPNGGESWQTGSTQALTWTDNITENVKIDLYKGGNFYYTIVSSTESDGYYLWTVPDTLQAGVNYKVKISSILHSSITDQSDGNFTVFNQQIIVTLPNGGESWNAGTGYGIEWTDNISDNVKIDLIKGGSLYYTIAVSEPSDGYYAWAVPDTLQGGSNYRIKITSVNNASVNDISDGDFTVVGKVITLTSPNGGENWQTSSSQAITWTDNITENVKIDLYKGGSFYYTINSSTESDGYYLWTVPDTVQGDSDYKVKITSVTYNTITDFSDDNFIIYETGITVTIPNGGESWNAGTGYGIEWTDNISDDVKIDLYKGGNFYYTIATSVPSNGYYAWAVPDTLQGGSNYRVKITSVANSNVTDQSDGDFTVVGKVITVTSPNGGENWQTGSSQAITWTDNITENVKIDLYKGGSMYHNIVSSTESDGYFLWTLPDTEQAGSDYKIKITSVTYNTISDLSDDNFSVYETGITVTVPNGEESWDAGTGYGIEWTDNISDNVKIDLIKGGSLYYTIAASVPSNGYYAWTVPDTLQGGNNYRIKITSVANSNVNDISDGDFTVVGKVITVTSPNGGENWQTGSSQALTWTDNITENVIIDLYKGSSFYYTIISSTESDGYYLWTVPDTLLAGSDYKIKITSTLYNVITDFSDDNFSVYETGITVTVPNGGESWDAGTGYGIEWTDNISENIKIDLIKGGSLYYTIATSEPSNGYYAWAVPDTLQGGSNYRVKITSVNNGFINDISDGNFTLVGKVITVTSPNGGENWQTGSTQPVTWTDNVVENVKIDLYKGGSLYYNIISTTESDGYYLWTIPDTLQAGSDYKVKITSVTYNTITDFSDDNFSIYETGITVTVPNGGESWDAGTGYGIEWTDNISDNVKIDLYKGGSLYYTITASEPSNGYYAWAVPDTLQGGNNYRVKITSTTNNNVNDISDGDFTIVGKVIMVTSPNGGENWQTGSTQAVTWADNVVENVKIDLYKGGSFYYTINSSTESDGYYLWTIPDTTLASSDYKIKITSILYNSINGISNSFSLFNAHVSISSPNGGENWNAGTGYGITWTDNISEDVKIDLYRAGSFYYTITDSTTSNGYYAWTIADTTLDGNNYRVKIISTANGNVSDISDADFTIVGKQITVTGPNGGEIWQTGRSYGITWTDNITENVKIDLYKGDNLYFNIISSTESDTYYAWDIPDSITNGNNYKIKISSVTFSTINDLSDSNFTLTNTLSVEYLSSNIPKEYEVFQNYPNPFNPSTRIEFGIPEESIVTIRIYNILGQEVFRILSDEILFAGMYRYYFNADNLSSGIYFFIVNAKSTASKKSFQETKKMMLLR
jgi:Kre9/KNH-like N-terminal Ig-like domain/Secretion system C-terminal sorting domain